MLLLLFAVGVRATTAAQDVDAALLAPQPGENATTEELRAFRSFQMRKFVRARELAAEVVKKDATSVVGHFVLGLVHHRGEANLPKALYHMERALALFEKGFGPNPTAAEPWLWHIRLLQELAFVHGDLEHHRDKLRYLARYNEVYDPDLIAEQAWPLMKLGEYDAARRVAEEALRKAPSSLDGGRQTVVALNALCAIEFEAGNDGVSYDACKRALDYGKTQPGGPSVVDFTNFAEAARSLFRLDEAERIALDATRASSSWYGNPWLELSELYTREGRFAESVAALREMRGLVDRRPPHVRDVDLHERWRGLASFLLMVGATHKALEITAKAVLAPDRSAFRSRDAAQDQAVMALLHRRVLLVEAHRLRELDSAAGFFSDFFGRVARWVGRLGYALRAWASAREAAKNMGDGERLVGSFRIGSAASGIMPPWLAPELSAVLGPGVYLAAVAAARARDERAGADAYYDAFEAEGALDEGDLTRASRAAARALRGLGPKEALLRARVEAIQALALERLGVRGEALDLPWERAYALDPGVFRRRGVALPVKFLPTQGALAGDVRAMLRRSPSFREAGFGFTVRVEVDAALGRLCLGGRAGAVLSCFEARPEADATSAEYLATLVDGFHQVGFAPRVDLSQPDINSLDGSNRVSRDPLGDLLSPGMDEP